MSIGSHNALFCGAATAIVPAATSGAARLSGSQAIPSPALTIANNVAARSAVKAVSMPRLARFTCEVLERILPRPDSAENERKEIFSALSLPERLTIDGIAL